MNWKAFWYTCTVFGLAGGMFAWALLHTESFMITTLVVVGGCAFYGVYHIFCDEFYGVHSDD